MASRPVRPHLASAAAFAVGLLITVMGAHVAPPPPPVTEIVVPVRMGTPALPAPALAMADDTLRDERDQLALQREQLQRRVAALEQRVARVSSELRTVRLHVRSRAPGLLLAAAPTLNPVPDQEPIAPEPSLALLPASRGLEPRRFAWLRLHLPEHQPIAPNPPSSR